jgi:hypothetical protein
MSWREARVHAAAAWEAKAMLVQKSARTMMLVDGRVLKVEMSVFAVSIVVTVFGKPHLYEWWTLKDLAAKYQYVEYSECWAHAFSPKLYEHAPLRVPQRSADVPFECCRLVVACGVEQVFRRKPAGSRTTPQRSHIMQGQHVVRMHPFRKCE